MSEEKKVEEKEEKETIEDIKPEEPLPTKSVHICTNLMEVTIMSEDRNDSLEKIKKVAESIVDKYRGEKINY